ncbi:MAG: Aspartyl/glutamyl-tRNA amidotransferase subunit B-related [Clostridia bacterium]|nr:Aspartyl/glutamyl-tRNA amidotransferase subunit B-related [Clostridia bacterium]
MTKIDIVRQEMMKALKEKNMGRKDALSLLLSALKAKFIDKRADLTEEEENAIVLKEIKEAQETLDSTPADRVALIEECQLRIRVYSEFAPQMMSEDEIKASIQTVLDQLGISEPQSKDKGIIMKSLMPLVKGKADGGLVNTLVGELLK